MKKTIKTLAATLAAVMLCSVAACGGNDPFKDDDVVSGKYNISITCQDENGEKALLEEVKREYEKLHPDVNVVIKSFTQSVPAYMANYATNQKKLPDVLWMPDDYFATFAEGGYFMDLRSYYESDAETDYSLYYESMLHAASYTGEFRPTTAYNGAYSGEKSDDGKYGLYFAPRDYNKIAIVYNKNMLKKIGVPLSEIPDTSEGWTVDEFIAFVKKITAKIEEQPAYSNYRAICLTTGWEPTYTTLMNALGSDGFAKEDGSLNYDSAKNRAIFDKLYDELYSDEYAISTKEANFKGGTVAMWVMSRPAIVGLSSSMVNEDGTPYYDFLAFPAKNAETGKNEIGAGCSGYAITKVHAEDEQTVNGVTKKTKDLAWELIKYMITKQGQETTGKMGSIQPVLKSLEENGAWRTAISDKLNHAAFSVGDELRLTSFNRYSPNVRITLRNYVRGFWSNLETRTEGAPSKREKLIEDVIKNFNSKKVLIGEGK